MLVREAIIIFGLLLFAGLMFFTGINWGLPSRAADPYLFGSHKPWTGKQIMDLAGSWDTTTSRGADIAMHPLEGRDKPVVLNDTDARRAEIVRRYRLYSCQPDEMITFRSLSRMKPSKLDFDPAMYQYGGLWIYPVGGLLKLASLFHLVTLRTDLAFYLDHPEAFARFYSIARCYSAIWGLIGVIVVFTLGKELTGKMLVGVAAASTYACMPVAIDLAHEAKPHLAGTVLMLMTVVAALRYVRSGSRKWWIWTGVFSGASMGMVLTGYAAFAVLPVMTMLRPMPWKQRLQITTSAALIGIAIFTLTNPYLPFNILFHRQVLHSNVGNYGNFYSPRISIAGLVVVGQSLVEGMSAPALIAGLAGIAIISASPGKPKAFLLPVSVAAVVFIQFILLAEGKTAEYARFALALDAILAIAAAMLVDCLPVTAREKTMMAAVLVAATAYFGLRYDINFIADTRPNSTRREAAEILQSFYSPQRVLDVWAEPAPYCMPPVDLFTWQIVLQPRNGTDPQNVGIRAVDYAARMDPLDPARALSPISWANKPFEISKPAPVSTRSKRP